MFLDDKDTVFYIVKTMYFYFFNPKTETVALAHGRLLFFLKDQYFSKKEPIIKFIIQTLCVPHP